MKDGDTAERVSEVERRSVRVGAIERQRFGVTGRGEIRAAGLAFDIGNVADGVREAERIVFAAKDGDGFVVVLEREIEVIGVAFDGAQAGKRVGEVRLVFGLAGESDGFGENGAGVVRTAVLAREEGLLNQFGDGGGHNWVIISDRRG